MSLNAADARRAADLLSVAIVTLVEDIHPETVLSALAARDDRSLRIRQVGEDVVVLAGALRVLERLGGKAHD